MKKNILRLSIWEKKHGIKITLNHNDKMSGLSSISTSPLCNGSCVKKANHKPTGNRKLICNRCYSVTMNKRFKNLNAMLKTNFEKLTTELLTDFPYLYSETGYFRIEAFGDLANTTQAINYLQIAIHNPQVKIAWWTKNPWFIDWALKESGLKKPKNLTIIGSSYFIDEPMDDYFRQFDFIDYCFTVYSGQKIKAENINITCGARSCADCGKCYERKHASYSITEKLK